MPSQLQRVAQGLVECLDQVPQVVAFLQRTASQCRENAALMIQLAGRDGNVAAQQLDAAARACEAAAHYLSLAPPKARGWAEGLIGAQPAPGSQPDPQSANRNPFGSGQRNGAASADERSSTGDGLLEPAPLFQPIFDRLPERPGGVGPTSGILTLIDGTRVIHVRSGQKGPGADAPGLTGRIAELKVTREHAEGHAAAIMRRPGAPREMTLYVNNRPCTQFYGCDRTLKYQLPPGAKLTVYWPGGHKVYVGEDGELL